MKFFLRIIFFILFFLSLGFNGYLVFFDNEEEVGMVLPIYKVTDSVNDITQITNSSVDMNYGDDYKLVNKVKCSYEICFWYDYGVSKSSSAKWIYYDNDKSNNGGYYIYDQKKNKTIAGPFKNVVVDVDKLSDEILQGVYLYTKNDKVGYYNLRGSNQMLFEPEYDYIQPSPYHSFYTVSIDDEERIYSFFNNELKEISEDTYDEFIFVKGKTIDYVITKKDDKYNFIYENLDLRALETNDNYDYLDVYEFSDKEFYNDYELYFIYVSEGRTFISKTTIDELIETNSLTPNLEFNLQLSELGEEFVIAKGKEKDTLYLYPTLEENEDFYVLNIVTNTLEKKVIEKELS